jgi:ElaA protein
MKTGVTWIWKHFDELNVRELYQILKLRSEVFVVEQACVYQDIDDLDQICWHLMGLKDEAHEKLAAYCRVTPLGTRFPEISIGRVVVKACERNQGLGKEVMKVALQEIETRFGKQPVTISAQSYLEDFYVSLGFKRVSDNYLEDNIPHVEMKMDKAA